MEIKKKRNIVKSLETHPICKKIPKPNGPSGKIKAYVFEFLNIFKVLPQELFAL